MGKQQNLRHFSVQTDSKQITTILQFATFYIFVDFLKSKMKRIVNKLDVPNQEEISFDKFNDQVVALFKYETEKLNEQFTKAVIENGKLLKLMDKMMKYPKEQVAFPADIAEVFAKENVNLISLGIKFLDSTVVSGIGWIWMIIKYIRLSNVAIEMAIKWAVYDYWKENNVKYNIVLQDPNVVLNIFVPDQYLDKLSPEREFDLMDFEVQKWRISYNGSREAAIQEIIKRRESNVLEPRWTQEDQLRFLRSLTPPEMKEVVVHTAIRVASEFIRTKITRTFNKHPNIPTPTCSESEKMKFYEDMYAVIPNPQELIDKFNTYICSYSNLDKLWWQIHMYWTGPEIADPNIVKKAKELNANLNEICHFIAKDNMECMFALFCNLVSSPNNYMYVRDNAIELQLNKYWEKNKNKILIENEKRILH